MEGGGNRGTRSDEGTDAEGTSKKQCSLPQTPTSITLVKITSRWLSVGHGLR